MPRSDHGTDATAGAASPAGAAAAPPGEERALLAALRRGEEAAFVALVGRYQSMLLRVARLYVASEAVAEEVVQDTWLGVLHGLDRFEERASLKTWLFRILVNRAKTRGVREGRSIPFSSAWDSDVEPSEPAVDRGRFGRYGPAPHQVHWTDGPRSWRELPEERLLAGETRACIQAALAQLSPSQREVMTLRDLEGWSAAEVCNALAISETNQRVLLHRARAKVRRALERYFDAAETGA